MGDLWLMKNRVFVFDRVEDSAEQYPSNDVSQISTDSALQNGRTRKQDARTMPLIITQYAVKREAIVPSYHNPKTTP